MTQKTNLVMIHSLMRKKKLPSECYLQSKENSLLNLKQQVPTSHISKRRLSNLYYNSNNNYLQQMRLEFFKLIMKSIIKILYLIGSSLKVDTVQYTEVNGNIQLQLSKRLKEKLLNKTNQKNSRMNVQSWKLSDIQTL